MAKGNFLTSQVRGKLGDIVFYRQEGEQVSRSRNRHPRNPKTIPQLYQRAIMSTVTLAYKAGREIYDHAFEGYSVGAGCQREYLSRNAKLLRSLIASDLDNGRVGAASSGRVVAPGTQSPVGFPGMIISAGNYPMVAWEFSKADADSGDPTMWKLPVNTAGETCLDYAARVGLVADDIFTFVMYYYGVNVDPILFRVRGVTGDGGALQYRQHFAFLRLRVKSSFVTSTADVSSAKLTDIFMIDSYSPDIDLTTFGELPFTDQVTLDVLVNEMDEDEGYIGLIRSRLDRDLRSDSVLWSSSATSYSGITSEWALAAWQQGTESVGDSDLILEGGGFGSVANVAPVVAPTLFLRPYGQTLNFLLVTAEGKIATNSGGTCYIARDGNNWVGADDESGLPSYLFNNWAAITEAWGVDNSCEAEYRGIIDNRPVTYVKLGDYRVVIGIDDYQLYEPSFVPTYQP